MGMKRTKTEEEYECIAMLLGMNWDSGLNTFYIMVTDINGYEMLTEYDADTMEEMSHSDLLARRDEYMRNKGIKS